MHYFAARSNFRCICGGGGILKAKAFIFPHPSSALLFLSFYEFVHKNRIPLLEKYSLACIILGLKSETLWPPVILMEDFRDLATTEINAMTFGYVCPMKWWQLANFLNYPPGGGKLPEGRIFARTWSYWRKKTFFKSKMPAERNQGTPISISPTIFGRKCPTSATF